MNAMNDSGFASGEGEGGMPNGGPFIDPRPSSTPESDTPMAYGSNFHTQYGDMEVPADAPDDSGAAFDEALNADSPQTPGNAFESALNSDNSSNTAGGAGAAGSAAPGSPMATPGNTGFSHDFSTRAPNAFAQGNASYGYSSGYEYPDSRATRQPGAPSAPSPYDGYGVYGAGQAGYGTPYAANAGYSSAPSPSPYAGTPYPQYPYAPAPSAAPGYGGYGAPGYYTTYRPVPRRKSHAGVIVAVALVMILVFVWAGIGSVLRNASRNIATTTGSGYTQSFSGTADESKKVYDEASTISSLMGDWLDKCGDDTAISDAKSQLDTAITNYTNAVGDPQSPSASSSTLASALETLEENAVDTANSFFEEMWSIELSKENYWDYQLADDTDLETLDATLGNYYYWSDSSTAASDLNTVVTQYIAVIDDINQTIDDLHQDEQKVYSINAASESEQDILAAADKITSTMGVESVDSSDGGVSECSSSQSEAQLVIDTAQAFYCGGLSPSNEVNRDKLFINTKAPNYPDVLSSYYFVISVKHELAHRSILITCGTARPDIAGDRYEAVTNAYAFAYLGADEKLDQDLTQQSLNQPGLTQDERDQYQRYLVTDSDKTIANQIHDDRVCE
ncbi:MAG: hypothetical protein PUF97_03455 [Bifidobacteriaceae bacterium]|nr:hypothetical protein [Bifidobacteriaceae bacterium]